MREGTILLVEDNEDDILLTKRAFKKNNILNEIVVARDGEEAIRILFGEHAPNGRSVQLPVLVLLDLQLPKIDGFEVLKRIRENDRTTLLPVVILTSSKEERDLLKGYSLRANSVIRKPVDFDQFAEALRLLGLYWLVLNEQPPKK